ncbi:MAG: class I SAM-dependent methyltransferase [Zestosphaera sp.]
MDMIRKLYADLIAEFFSDVVLNSSCADIGCGTLPTPLSLVRICRKVFIYDIDCKVTDIYRRHPKTTPLCTDIEDAEVFGDGQLKLVLALNILEHLKSPPRTLKKLYRSMAPGGYLLASVPSTSPECRTAFKGDKTHMWLLPRVAWIEIATEVGFLYAEEATRRLVSAVKPKLIKTVPRSFIHLYKVSMQYPLESRLSGYIGVLTGLFHRFRLVVNPCSEIMLFSKRVDERGVDRAHS